MSPTHGPVDATSSFYVEVLRRLEAERVPFLIGGAFAFARYVNIVRDTKDLDLFLKRDHLPRALAILQAAGFRCALPFPHWLAKVYGDHSFVDLIFSSGNGVATVDDVWFEHAVPAEVFGMRLRLCPAEEMIWSKAFVQERERFDGADVIHLFQAMGPALDWGRLLARFDRHWRVLLSHIVLFGFVYPSSQTRIPTWVTNLLMDRLAGERADSASRLCHGPLLSREQYLTDIEQWGYADARRQPYGPMTDRDIEIWTRAIGEPDVQR